MTDYWTFALAFVLTPLIVAGIAYAAVRWHERENHQHPAE